MHVVVRRELAVSFSFPVDYNSIYTGNFMNEDYVSVNLV